MVYTLTNNALASSAQAVIRDADCADHGTRRRSSKLRLLGDNRLHEWPDFAI